MSYYPEFGDLLDERLATIDISGARLARQLDVNPSTVTRWRSGESRPATPEMVVRIADILGVYGAEQDAWLRAAGYAPTEARSSQEDVPQGSNTLNPIPSAAQSQPSSLLPNPTYRTLVNRKDQLQLSLNALQDATGRWIVGIDGMGGIGKTALGPRYSTSLSTTPTLYPICLGECGKIVPRQRLEKSYNRIPLPVA